MSKRSELHFSVSNNVMITQSRPSTITTIHSGVPSKQIDSQNDSKQEVPDGDKPISHLGSKEPDTSKDTSYSKEAAVKNGGCMSVASGVSGNCTFWT